LDEVVEHPAHFVAFDLLRDSRGIELLDQPLKARRTKLERLFRGALPRNWRYARRPAIPTWPEAGWPISAWPSRASWSNPSPADTSRAVRAG
jgi:ATP-dependent DNA ligase